MGVSRVRTAHPEDAAELARLNAAFNGEEGALAADVVRRALLEGSEIVIVAQEEGEIAGFACGQVCASFCYPRPFGELTELYVDPAHRRKGIATELVGAAEEEMRKRGADCVRLLTGSGNRAARALYERCGYAPEDEALYTKELRT